MGPVTREQMNDINTNILLGTNYLAMVYNQFDDSAVLATGTKQDRKLTPRDPSAATVGPSPAEPTP